MSTGSLHRFNQLIIGSTVQDAALEVPPGTLRGSWAVVAVGLGLSKIRQTPEATDVA